MEMNTGERIAWGIFWTAAVMIFGVFTGFPPLALVLIGCFLLLIAVAGPLSDL